MYTSLKQSVLLLAASLAFMVQAGCAATPATSCELLCDQLMGACGYAAYPSVDSCLQGCFYNEDEGADTDAHLACVEEAACDTFAIVECENQHGADSDD